MTNLEMAEKNYARGLWTAEMLGALVKKGKLTQAEYEQITSPKMVIPSGGGGANPLIIYARPDGTEVRVYG